uniref:uncharacterized protein LOC122606976 n=1 Tax=Erigeron canadensis TaxID=72917 RepID=UPI001CB9714C|nr:uncharacterized protein LOC122606976 [Erigeron canadensis]
MDHHHHSWQSIPGNNNNICPVCSFSHFPFCPPIPNPNFHYSPPVNSYNPPPPPPQFPYNTPPPNSFDSNHRYNTFNTNNHNYNNNDYYNGYDIGNNAGIKRMKFDNNPNPNPNNNERILKLIHDHGNAAADFGSGEIGLKRRRSDVDDRLVHHGNTNTNTDVVYDQTYELFPSRFDSLESNYSLSSKSQFPPHHLHMHHDYVSPHDVNLNSHVPYNNNNHWSESRPNYEPNSFGTDFHHAPPPLPTSPPPPPPLPIDPPPPPPPRNHFFEPPMEKPSFFPVPGSSSAVDSSSARSAVLDNPSSRQVYYTNNDYAGHHASTISSTEDFHTRQSSSERYVRDSQQFPLRHLPLEKPTIVDASQIFKHPHRASRPDHLVIILRGLPGSGKSYMAKMLRDVEVENGGEAPRIHSMDEYFMTEVEKAEDSELSKASGALRGKRQVMKKVMEYCYEPEMEEAYRASMLKAFKKTLDEGVFSFIIVDDRNLRVADFAQFWATAKRSGYEVYIVEAAYKDPVGCAARNVHNFTLDNIQKMATQWEEAPSLYMKMDIKSLLHRDNVDENGIQEVDMDMEDEDSIDASQGTDVKSPQVETKNQVDNFTPNDASPVTDLKHPVLNQQKEVNHLSKSKWSNDLDGSESIEAEDGKRKASALSGLINAYSKEGKSVQWGDQGGNVGFSIGATRKTSSLVIGPGSGYNLKSNPLLEAYLKPANNIVESKRQNVFHEQIRAERESFKAVFDKRRQRIGGFNIDEE